MSDPRRSSKRERRAVAWSAGRATGPRLASALAAAVFAAGCQHTVTSWTPSTVAPPVSVSEAATRASAETETPVASPAHLALSPSVMVELTLQHNPSLVVSRLGPAVAETRVSEAKAVFDPDLAAVGSHWATKDDGNWTGRTAGEVQLTQPLATGTELWAGGGIEGGDVGSGDSWRVGVNQSLLRGFSAEANLVDVRQAENGVAISEHELRGFAMGLALAAETAYWDLVLAKEVLSIRDVASALAWEQRDLTEDMIGAGKLAGDALASAEAEVALRNADMVDARIVVQQRTLAVLQLLSSAQTAAWDTTVDTSPIRLPDNISLNSGISAELANQFRPDLAQARLELANRELVVVRARDGLLPDLSAFASYGSPGQAGTGGNPLMATSV